MTNFALPKVKILTEIVVILYCSTRVYVWNLLHLGSANFIVMFRIRQQIRGNKFWIQEIV